MNKIFKILWKFTLILIIINLLFSFNWNNIVGAFWAGNINGNTNFTWNIHWASYFWNDRLSPTTVIRVNWEEVTYYFFPWYINPHNMNWQDFWTDGWCALNNEFDRLQYKASFGTNAFICKDVTDSQFNNFIKYWILAKSTLSNIAQMYGKRTPDLTMPRYFLIAREVKITNPQQVVINNANGDIYYNWGDSYVHLMNVFDPDLQKWSLENELYWSTQDKKIIPHLTFSAYVLDSKRLTDNLLWSWVYTIEHFAWKKYKNNNWNTLETNSFDNIPLYNLTYYDQPFLPLQDYKEYCNAENISVNELTEIETINPLRKFQNKDSSNTIEENRDWICSWTSWLRVNNGYIDWILPSWSVKLQWNLLWQVINWKEKNYNGDLASYVWFKPRGHDWQIWEIKIQNKWVIWNVRNFKEKWDREIRRTLIWQNIKLYYLVKTNLLYDNYDWVNIAPNYIAENNDLVWFDPVSPKWYNNELNHRLVSNINSLSVDDINWSYKNKNWIFNQNSLIYKSIFAWYPWSVWDAKDWEWNMFIPFAKENEIFWISTPWFVTTPSKYSDDEDIKFKMRNRWVHIPLTAWQWYSVTEKNNQGLLGTRWDQNKNPTHLAISSRAVINWFWVKDWRIRAIFNRNFDADSLLEEQIWKPHSDTDRDEDLWYKIFSKSSFKRNSAELIDLYWWEDYTNSLLYNIPWFKFDFKVAKETNWECKSKFHLPYETHSVFWILWPKENKLNCSTSTDNSALVAVSRLSWNTSTNKWASFSYAEQFQQWVEWIVKDNSISKISSKWLYFATIYDHINDSEVYNQVFTNSNYVENIWKPKLECLLNIYKIPFNRSPWIDSLYQKIIRDRINLKNIATYTDWTDIFEINHHNIFNISQLHQIIDSSISETDFNLYKQTFYTDNWVNTFDDWYSRWNVWERWVATYYCNNLPRDKKYNVFITNTNELYNKTESESFKYDSYKIPVFQKVTELASLPKIVFKPTNIMWYDNNYTGWRLRTSTDDWTNFYKTNADRNYFEGTYPWWNITWTTLWFVTNWIQTKDHAKWGLEFYVDDTTEWKYSKVTMTIQDADTKEIVFSNEHYILVDGVKKTLAITKVEKNEQTVDVWYQHNTVGFNGWWQQFQLSYTIKNNSPDNYTCSASWLWNTANRYILLEDISVSVADNNPVWKQIKEACELDELYDCNTDTNNTNNEHRLSKTVLEKLIQNNWISIFKWDSEKSIINWNAPQANKYVAQLIDKWGKKAIKIYFPTNENYFSWNTEYTIKFALQPWVFNWTNFWKSLQKWNTHSISIIPRTFCEVPNWWQVKEDDLPLEANVNKGNMYTKLIVGWEQQIPPVSWECMAELTFPNNAPNTNLLKYLWQWGSANWTTVRAFLHEWAAKANWTSCSEQNVFCLIDVKWEIYDWNIDSSSLAGSFRKVGMSVNEDLYFSADMIANDIPTQYFNILYNQNTNTNKLFTFKKAIQWLNVKKTLVFNENPNFEMKKWFIWYWNFSNNNGLININNDTQLSKNNSSLNRYKFVSSYMNATWSIKKENSFDKIYSQWTKLLYKWLPNCVLNNNCWDTPWNFSFIEWGWTWLLHNIFYVPNNGTNVLLLKGNNNSAEPSKATMSEEERTVHFWMKWKLKALTVPTAKLKLEFPNSNLLPAQLSWKTCEIPVNFGELETCEVQPPEIWDLRIAPWTVDGEMYLDKDATFYDIFSENSWKWNAIDTCWVWNPTDKEFSMEYENFKRQEVFVEVGSWDNVRTVKRKTPSGSVFYNTDIYNPSECASGKYSKEDWNPVTIFIKIPNRGSLYDKCMVNTEDLWISPTDVNMTWDGIQIKNIELFGWESKSIEVACALKWKEPSCSQKASVSHAELKTSNWTVKTNETRFRTCMLPTIKITEPAIVTDGNNVNDKIQNVYSTAYPFEIKQCWGLKQSWGFQYKGWCGSEDEDLKRIKLRWYQWISYDDDNTIAWWTRDFFTNLEIPTIWGVNAVKNNWYYEWDLSKWTFDSILNTSHNITIWLNPWFLWGQRWENSYFELIDGTNWKVKFEVADTAKMLKAWNTYLSTKLSSALWYDPKLTGQKLWDDWNYTFGEEPVQDDNWVEQHLKAYLYKQEIDWTSKLKDEQKNPLYTPVHYQITINNPIKNNFYGLTWLEYNLELWPTSNIFHSIDNRFPTSGENLEVTSNNVSWWNQNLPAGWNIPYKVSLKLNPTLKQIANPYSTPPLWANSTSGGRWVPKMRFANSSCDFNLTNLEYEIEIKDNPLIIEDFEFEDNVWNPWDFNQHLPWDTMSLNFWIRNTTEDRDFNKVFIDIDFEENSEISNPNVRMDMTKLFKMNWNPVTNPFVWQEYQNLVYYEIPKANAICWLWKTKLVCQLTKVVKKSFITDLKIPLLINIENWFYQNLKAYNGEEKYWYPVKIKKIRFGTEDFNNWNVDGIGAVTYYTSNEANIPAGWRMWDFNALDINNPSNLERSQMPYDGNYNFYIWIPYISINNELINNSIWHISPGDIITFRTTVESRSKALIRDILLNQQLYLWNLNTDYVDTEILNSKFTSNKTNFLTPSKTVDFEANWMIKPENIENIRIQNFNIPRDENWQPLPWTHNVPTHNVEGWNLILYSDGAWYSYLEWTQDPDNVIGWSISILTKVKIGKIKSSKLPQIGCWISPIEWCDRANSENPKNEKQAGYADIAFVWTDRDAEEQSDYKVYFPILKSILFKPINNSYEPTPSSNIIKWSVWSSDTKVVYRVDNFIPTWYSTSQGIWKARLPKAHIKLPVWVTYVPNSLMQVKNLQSQYPYWTEEKTPFEPIINSNSEYTVIEGWNSNFDNNFLNPNSWWKKVDKTNWLNFAILKWTPFGFNFFNENYNYFRLTDDGAISLWYKKNSPTLSEGQYYIDKQNWKIIANTDLTVKFDKTLSGVLLPNNTAYTNFLSQERVSDWIEKISVKSGSKVEIKAGEEIVFTKWMESVSILNGTASRNSTDVIHNNTSFTWYKLITPAFVKLDLRDKNNRKHWIYEKIITNPLNQKEIEWVAYQWYWYVEGTNKEVKFGVIIYSTAKHNTIRFTYWEIDPTLDINVVSWISNEAEVKYWTYNNTLLQNLSNKNDVIFDASSIYQELVFDIWYPPYTGDIVPWQIIDYEEREATPPHLFIDKPLSKQAFTFNVNIQSDASVCQTEYVSSLWGTSLRWNRLTSLQTDFDDVDTFCFEAERPWIAIIENGSYAKWGYKTAQDTCVVNHLSLMWFNWNAIGWNDKRDNNCWLTYNIKVKQKELSLENISPFHLLWEFSDKIDTRPIDFNKLIENQKIVFNTPQAIKIIDDTWVATLSGKIPDFKTVWVKIHSKNIIYLYWFSANENASYLIRTTDLWANWKILKKFENKKVINWFIYDTNVQMFFNNWTYMRNVSGGIWDTWNTATLPWFVANQRINEIKYRTNTMWFIIWDNATLWKTSNSGRTYEQVDIVALTWISSNDNITSIDVYWTNDIWLSTSSWNILYSINGWNSFTVKDIWNTTKNSQYDFEDDSIVFKTNSWIKENHSLIWTKDLINIKDTDKSIKFDNMWVLNLANKTSPYSVIKNRRIMIDDTTMQIPNTLNWTYNLKFYISDMSVIGKISKIRLSWTHISNSWLNSRVIIHLDNYLKDKNLKIHNGYNEIAINIENMNPRYIELLEWNLTEVLNIKQIDFDFVEVSWLNNYNNDFFAFIGFNHNWQQEFLSNTNTFSQLNIVNNHTNWTPILALNGSTISLGSSQASVITKWYLLFELYINSSNEAQLDKTQLPNMLRIWDNNWDILIKNLMDYVVGWDIKKWWNNFKVPLEKWNNPNIIYNNIDNVNWTSVSKFEIWYIWNSLNINKPSYFALDNIALSSLNPVFIDFVKFFNTKEWVMFTDNNIYTTIDNNIWNITKELWTEWLNNPNLSKLIKIRGREIYWVWNSANGWFSIYSLDKWQNYNIYNSNSNVNLTSFDIIDYNLWVAISDDNLMYLMNTEIVANNP